MVDLCPDFFPSQILCLERHNIYLGVGMTHVTNDTPIFHIVHVGTGHNRFIAGGCDNDVNAFDHDI